MDTLINIVSVVLVAAYGCAGVLFVICQDRIWQVLAVAGGCLLTGILLYPFLYTIASVIAWIIAIALALYVLSVFFG